MPAPATTGNAAGIAAGMGLGDIEKTLRDLIAVGKALTEALGRGQKETPSASHGPPPTPASNRGYETVSPPDYGGASPSIFPRKGQK